MVSPDLHRHSSVVVDVELVLHEKGGQNDYLFPRIEDGLEHDVECSACTAGHDDMICAHAGAGISGQLFGHGCPGFLISCIVHIPVHAWQRVLCEGA